MKYASIDSMPNDTIGDSSIIQTDNIALDHPIQAGQKRRKTQPTPDMSPCPDLADEEITVMPVPCHAQKARKKFTDDGCKSG